MEGGLHFCQRSPGANLRPTWSGMRTPGGGRNHVAMRRQFRGRFHRLSRRRTSVSNGPKRASCRCTADWIARKSRLAVGKLSTIR